MTGAGAVRNTAGVQAGQSVAIFGVGGVGLAAIAAAAVIGATVTVQQTLAATKYGVWGGARGGTAVLVGLPVEPVDLEMGEVLFGQRTYLGSVGGSSDPDRDFPLFLEWFRDGQLDLTGLVTQRYRLEEINEGFAALARGEILGRAIIEL